MVLLLHPVNNCANKDTRPLHLLWTLCFVKNILGSIRMMQNESAKKKQLL